MFLRLQISKGILGRGLDGAYAEVAERNPFAPMVALSCHSNRLHGAVTYSGMHWNSTFECPECHCKQQWERLVCFRRLDRIDLEA